MERVTGIGGFFFRAKDRAALAAWYRDVLGISIAPDDADTPPWTTEAGITVFAPFAETTEYFHAGSQFMVNFRVSDLDAMVAQIEASGTQVFNRSEMEGVGRFAHLHDPEDNPIELWEPET